MQYSEHGGRVSLSAGGGAGNSFVSIVLTLKYSTYAIVSGEIANGIVGLGKATVSTIRLCILDYVRAQHFRLTRDFGSRHST
jgi:hypothetical protein